MAPSSPTKMYIVAVVAYASVTANQSCFLFLFSLINGLIVGWEIKKNPLIDNQYIIFYKVKGFISNRPASIFLALSTMEYPRIMACKTINPTPNAAKVEYVVKEFSWAKGKKNTKLHITNQNSLNFYN